MGRTTGTNHSGNRGRRRAAAVAARPPPAEPAIRVAVIDFQGAGAISGYESLGAGLQSMLTTDLAASHSIAVVERTKLAALRQEMKLSRSAAADPKTALRVGKLAGATHLVTGTFTLVGKELRLDARTIEIATGRVVLATDAKGERDAFFELEKKLANAIVAGIGVSLSPKERASMARIQTADFEAFRRFGDGLSPVRRRRLRQVAGGAARGDRARPGVRPGAHDAGDVPEDGQRDPQPRRRDRRREARAERRRRAGSCAPRSRR